MKISQHFLMGLMAGSISTLIATGSIKTHFNTPAYKPSTVVVTSAVPAQPVSLPSSANSTNIPKIIASNELAKTFKAMLVAQGDNLKIAHGNVSIVEARQQVYNALALMKSIRQGSGTHPVYVLFDPLCPHCHTLYRKFADGWASELDLTVHWIPSVAFMDNDQSVLISQRFITALNADKQTLALAALDAIVAGDYELVLSDEWLTTDQALVDLTRSTMGLIQIGGGTPAVVFKSTSGLIEIINGVPTKTDFDVLTQ